MPFFQTCNREIFQLLSWESVWKCCRKVKCWQDLQQEEGEGNENSSSRTEVDLSDEAMPPDTWKNTITTYSKVRTC